jgi:nuclear control of ATPase protein 2
MSLALAKEKLNYTAAQLQELSSLIREGDLTPVLRIYEEDIKSPVKSAVSGTLLRSLFIQVQKAKVDIDQALAGIDKLLKSQELTFAFVGVAPAFALVYTLGGVLRHFLVGGTQRGRYGGVRRRTGAWLAIRFVVFLLVLYLKFYYDLYTYLLPNSRIERLLLTSQPESSTSATGDIAPLTAGLLLLSVSHLREYATGFLPLGSRVREGVLEDVGDLEDPALGREAKLRIVERMWRNWGNKLGWTGLGEK